jgi:hypothetical protein
MLTHGCGFLDHIQESISKLKKNRLHDYDVGLTQLAGNGDQRRLFDAKFDTI